MEPTLSLRGVWKVYGSRAVLRDVELEVTAGQVTAVVGANGAGKTTLFRLLAGVARPDRGAIIRKHKRVAYLAHEQMVYGDLTVTQHLQFWGLDRSEKAKSLVERFGLSALLDRKARLLSQGYRQMLSTVQVFGAEADLYVLDEPAVALDTQASAILAELVAAEKNRGASVVLSEHRDLGWAAPQNIVRVVNQNVEVA